MPSSNIHTYMYIVQCTYSEKVYFYINLRNFYYFYKIENAKIKEENYKKCEYSEKKGRS